MARQGVCALQWLKCGGLRAAQTRREAVHGGPGWSSSSQRSASCRSGLPPSSSRPCHEPEFHREARRYMDLHVGSVGFSVIPGGSGSPPALQRIGGGPTPRHHINSCLPGNRERAAVWLPRCAGPYLGVLAGAAVRARGARRGIRHHQGIKFFTPSCLIKCM